MRRTRLLALLLAAPLCALTASWYVGVGDTETPAASSRTRLAVSVEYLSVDDYAGVTKGTAMWNPGRQILTYMSREGYSGSCSPEGSVRLSEGTLVLELNRPLTERACSADANIVVATIAGLTGSPTELTVSEGGETRTVPLGADALAQTGTTPPPGPVDLPTNQWREGDGGVRDPIEGVLSVDENGCVYLANSDPAPDNRAYVLWPADYTANLDQQGNLTLMGPNGRLVARDGDKLTMRGAYPVNTNNEPCIPNSQEIVPSVQSEVAISG